MSITGPLIQRETFGQDGFSRDLYLGQKSKISCFCYRLVYVVCACVMILYSSLETLLVLSLF